MLHNTQKGVRPLSGGTTSGSERCASACAAVLPWQAWSWLRRRRQALPRRRKEEQGREELILTLLSCSPVAP
eukprot:1482425-Pyramimonas_sp.AAC.1